MMTSIIFKYTFHDHAVDNVPQGNEGVVDMFCRILISVDEDLVSLDIPRCVEVLPDMFG